MDSFTALLLVIDGVLLLVVLMLALGYQHAVERRLVALEQALIELRIELEFWRK